MNPSQVPDGWHVKKLKENGEVIIGLTYSPKDVVDSGGIEVLRSSNVKHGRIVLDDLVRVDAKIPEKIILQNGDILICARNGSRRLIGKNARVNELNVGKTFGAFMCVYRSTNPDYMFWLFQTQSFRKQIARDLGPTINQITSGNLNSFRFAFPEAKEQHRITSVLQLWDDALKILDATIESKQNIKKGLMQQLLTGKARHPGFVDEWEFTKLSSVCTINPSDKGVPQSFLYIDLESVAKGRLSKILDRINIDDAPIRAQRVLKNSDVLFQTVRPSQRNNYYFDLGDGYVASTGYALLRAKGSAKFLYHFVHSEEFVKEVLRMCTGSNYPAINSSDLAKIKVRFPSLDEQIRIEEVLSVAEDDIQLLEEKRKSIEMQKKYLVNNLVIGKLRTPDNLRSYAKVGQK